MYVKIDLSNSALSRKEKAKLKMLLKYRDVFILRDEIGECPNLEADIKVFDESPFFVRHFQFLRMISYLWTNKWKDWCL